MSPIPHQQLVEVLEDCAHLMKNAAQEAAQDNLEGVEERLVRVLRMWQDEGYIIEDLLVKANKLL